MKTQFGQEKLEQLTSKFILELANFLYDQKITWINVNDVIVNSKDELNQETTIEFQDFQNNKFTLIVSHAKDMCCSNWNITKSHSVKQCNQNIDKAKELIYDLLSGDPDSVDNANAFLKQISKQQ